MRDWIRKQEIPPLDGGAEKGLYVGFRNDAGRAMERFWRMPGSEFVAKEDVLLIEVRLSAKNSQRWPRTLFGQKVGYRGCTMSVTPGGARNGEYGTTTSDYFL